MIQTLIVEPDTAPSVAQIECLCIPGMRKVYFGHSLRYSYQEFAIKLFFFMKQLGYTHYMHKFSLSVDSPAQKLRKNIYELPLLLATLQTVGILQPNLTFTCNGTISSEGVVRFMPEYELLLESSAQHSINYIYSSKEILLSNLVTKISHFFKQKAISVKSKALPQKIFLIGPEAPTVCFQGISKTTLLWLKLLYPDLEIINYNGSEHILLNHTLNHTYEKLPSQIKKELSIIFDFPKILTQKAITLLEKFMQTESTLIVRAESLIYSRDVFSVTSHRWLYKQLYSLITSQETIIYQSYNDKTNTVTKTELKHILTL